MCWLLLLFTIMITMDGNDDDDAVKLVLCNIS